MTFTDLAKSYVRTIVPAVVGAIIAWALHHGHDIHGYEAQLTLVITAVYYGLARLLEHCVSPRFGWLLGVAQKPAYAKADQPLVRRQAAINAVNFALTGSGLTVRDHLELLPAPSGRKGGLLPSPRDDRDWQAKLPAWSEIPPSCDYGAGLTFGMLLNDRIGDCYPAALLHALQVLTNGAYTPTDADALHVYEQVTGYDPTRTDANGDNPTDQGTYGRQLFDWARKRGLIESYAAVVPTRSSVKAAIAAHKAVLCEWALPAGAETEGDAWTMPRKNRVAGSWGGHATVEVGYTTRHNRNVTWGKEGTVTPAFEDAYLQAAWVVTAAATIPPIAG